LGRIGKTVLTPPAGLAESVIEAGSESGVSGRDATIRGTQETRSPRKGLYLWPSTDGRSYTLLRRLRQAFFDAPHRLFLLRVSLREIGREFCSFVRRTRTLLTTTRHYYTGIFGPDLGPSGGLGENERPVSCTRTLGRIQDTQSLLQSTPEATQTDADWFLVGWDKGAEWAASHPHFCSPGSCSRYVVLAPYRASIPSVPSR
jgi:hypothetical protein